LLLQTWRYLVLDEGHRVRNEDTLTVKALRAVRRGNVLLLTGARV
jgi:SNF2 family DNA or RNA helicase